MPNRRPERIILLNCRVELLIPRSYSQLLVPVIISAKVVNKCQNRWHIISSPIFQWLLCYRGQNYFAELTSKFYADLNKLSSASKKVLTSYICNTWLGLLSWELVYYGFSTAFKSFRIRDFVQVYCITKNYRTWIKIYYAYDSQITIGIMYHLQRKKRWKLTCFGKQVRFRLLLF